MKNAVIVAGHAVLKHFRDPLEEGNWALVDFQKQECSSYVEHVRCGVELTAADPQNLLILSGGQSRSDAGPRCEAQTLLFIAEHYAWFGHAEVATRAITEEFARDSFENLLFGICRFREYTGEYPEQVTVVSWAFKEQRFHLHREAIGWPRSRFSFPGPNNPPAIGQALAAEAVAIEKYKEDPYSGSEEFQTKRRERNPFRRQHGYFTSCPEIAGLFVHRGPWVYRGPLPWTRR